MNPVRLTSFVAGQVQGVGFRWATRAKALQLGLVGTATNKPDGRVEVIAEGSTEACTALLSWLRSGGTPGTVGFVGDRIGPARGGFTTFSEA